MTKSLSLLLNKNDNSSLVNMSKSLASFHLTGVFTLIMQQAIVEYFRKEADGYLGRSSL